MGLLESELSLLSVLSLPIILTKDQTYSYQSFTLIQRLLTTIIFSNGANLMELRLSTDSDLRLSERHWDPSQFITQTTLSHILLDLTSFLTGLMLNSKTLWDSSLSFKEKRTLRSLMKPILQIVLIGELRVLSTQ